MIRGVTDQPRHLDPLVFAEAARQLRAIVEALPPTTALDRATARRVQGAATALEALAAVGFQIEGP